MSQNGDAEPLACRHTLCKTKGGTVRTYVVEYPDGRLVVELCRKHADPLTNLRKEMLRANVQLGPRVAPRSAATDPPMRPDEMPDDL